MTIRFEDLCKRLKDNTEEKNVYFNHLEAENFLLPFDRKGMLNFDDAAGGAVISYLQRLLANNANLKNIIIDVINKNLDIEPLNLNYYNYMALVDFISSFDLKDIEKKIHYQCLLDMNNFTKLLKKLFKQDISNAKQLSKNCIAALIKYPPITQNDIDKNILNPKYDIERYDIKQLFNELPFKENLYKTLQGNEIYNLLISQYSKIYQEFGNKDLSIYQRQCIDFRENGEDNYSEFDVRNIILDCLSFSIESNNSVESINFLLDSDITMFNKLGLYYISKNFNKYKDLFVKYFNSLNEPDLHLVRYEIMTILENIDDETTTRVVNKLKSFSKETRYYLLHSVKKNQNRTAMTESLNNLFTEFEALKQLFGGEEIENPKFLFKVSTSSIVQKSPISKEKFKLKTIKEQIKYINNYKETKENYFLTKDNTLITEAKLNDVFRNVFSENINQYLQNEALLTLKKDTFMCSVFEVLEQSLRNKTITPNKDILRLLKTFKTNTNGDVFHYRRFCLLATLIENNEDMDITSSLIDLLKEFIKQAPEPANGKEELIAINEITQLGKYLNLFLLILAKDNSLYDEKYSEFLSTEFDQADDMKNKIFYYNWGRYYHWLKNIDDYKFEKLNTEELKNTFIEGVVNNSNTLELYNELKTDILKYFKKTTSGIAKNNIIYFLIHIKFVHKDNELFDFFEKNFTPKDKKDFWWNTLYPKREQKYDQKIIFDYWEKTINDKANFPQILLQVFNAYVDIDSFGEHIDNLENLFRLYENRDTSIRMGYELLVFMENLVKFANCSKFEEVEHTKIFDLLSYLIDIFKYYDYVSLTIAKHLLIVLQKYYEYSNDIGNFDILYNQILNATNLIQYSDIFVEYKYSING